MIRFEGVSKEYKTKKGVITKALKNVSFSLPEKGMIFILGKSGSGKSTLLNLLGGLDKPTEGEIFVQDRSMKKFRSKDYDYYRNTYLGFVFQEFYLLETYNVYDNIALALKLQKKKRVKENVAEVLKQVGLEGLEKRKVNELSGGQKQRVSIARALIKEPKMILADEPTGSLDEETGRQIFELLKDLSKDKLVVIVSHDRESAETYADAILEIHDGEIIKNTISKESEEGIFKIKKSSFPFPFLLKLSFLNLGHKKLKLFFTILLIFASLTFYGISNILSIQDVPYSHAKAMNDNKEEKLTFKKLTFDPYSQSYYDSGLETLNEEDQKYIKEKSGEDLYPVYIFNEENRTVGLVNSLENFKEAPIYYGSILSNNLYFVELTKPLNEKILGRMPEAEDEILIHSYLAELFMYHGVLLYSEDPLKIKEEYYKPESFQQILDEGKYLQFGSYKLKVVGIIEDDTDEFSYLKERKMETAITPTCNFFGICKDEDGRDEFYKKIVNPAYQVYVMENFHEKVPLEANTEVDGNLYQTKIKIEDKSLNDDQTYRYPDKKITFLTKEKEETRDTLNINEIIINESTLDRLSMNRYEEAKRKYIENYQKQMKPIEDEIKSKVQKNNQLMEEYQKKVKELEEKQKNGQALEEEIPYPTLEEIPDVEIKDEDTLTKEFLQNYLKENDFIGKEITLSFLPNEEREYLNRHDYEHVKIIGISFEDKNYLSTNLAKEVMKKNASLTSFISYEDDPEVLERLFTDFPITGKKYAISTMYSEIIGQVSSSLKSLGTFAFYASLVFAVFAFILLVNFIVTSIYDNKKTIGILRALGTRKKDVFKIFLCEGFFIGIFALILTFAALFFFMNWLNAYITEYLFFEVTFILFPIKARLLLILSVIVSILLASFLTSFKISKMKPVDAINNK